MVLIIEVGIEVACRGGNGNGVYMNKIRSMKYANFI